MKKIILNFCFYVGIAIIIVVTLFPLYYAIISSFKSGTEIFKVSYLPFPFELENYISIFTKNHFEINLLNSFIVSTMVVAISLILGITAAYALGRIQFKGRFTLLLIILSASMFPQIAVLAGLYEIIGKMGMFNSLYSLILSYMIFVIPFTVWVLTVFMRDFPDELEKAALIDGASTFTIIFKIIMPILWPSLVSVGLLSFIAAWNEFLFALTFLSSDEMRTVPVAIALLSGTTEYEIPWGNIMAASVIVTVPLVVLVFIFQRKIISGLTAGAVKG